MEDTSISRTGQISYLFRTYCKENLDDEYLRLCNKLFTDLIEREPEIFKRGKENIWAAAIVWALGSVNFLYDKSSEPYASLSDVCSYFGSNTSTVGQKASKIRNLLKIDYFNPDYQREDSQITAFLNDLVMTENGIIVHRSSLEEDSEDGLEGAEVQEEPDYYIIIIESRTKFKTADIYQLEYLFKTFLEEDELLQKIELADKKVHIYFYGRPEKIIKFDKKIQSGQFTITNVINQPDY